MSEIQEQVEDFLNNWICLIEGEDLPKAGDEFRKEYYALLRRFVEECCKAKCAWCAQGYEPIKGTEPEGYSYHNETIMAACQSWQIRRHFAWLLEGE